MADVSLRNSVPERKGSQAELQHRYLYKGNKLFLVDAKGCTFSDRALVPSSTGARAVPTLPLADEVQAVKPTARPQNFPAPAALV